MRCKMKLSLWVAAQSKSKAGGPGNRVPYNIIAKRLHSLQYLLFFAVMGREQYAIV